MNKIKKVTIWKQMHVGNDFCNPVLVDTFTSKKLAIEALEVFGDFSYRMNCTLKDIEAEKNNLTTWQEMSLPVITREHFGHRDFDEFGYTFYYKPKGVCSHEKEPLFKLYFKVERN